MAHSPNPRPIYPKPPRTSDSPPAHPADGLASPNNGTTSKEIVPARRSLAFAMTPRSFPGNPKAQQTLAELLALAVSRKTANELGWLAPLERAAQDPSQCRLVRVGGGDINEVYRVDLPHGPSLLLKWHADPPYGFFEAEAEGLSALAATRTLRIPRVLAWSHHGLLMEWLERRPDRERHWQTSAAHTAQTASANHPAASTSSDPGEALGRGLAALHRTTAQAFGFARDNFVGLLPQRNAWQESWVSFFREQRLKPQLLLASEKGFLTRERRALAERLLDQLPRWIDDRAVLPALVHGDLWHGNWLDTADGAALIDPAAYYGDREMDLAMASLFGGFPESFWRTYEEAYPLLPGFEERRPLYQLYYLLIHLNLFGEAYGPAVDRILRHYGR